MKLFTTIGISLFTLVSLYGQHFEVDPEIKTIYSNYRGYCSTIATLDNKYVIHGGDYLEIADIQSGKIVFEWDPKGGDGQSYASKDGKWIANRSQNHEDPNLGYVDAYQVLNTQTKEEYLTTVPDELWTTTGFSHNSNEVAIQAYNFDMGKVKLIRYDFINQKILSTPYTSENSGTVILAIDYSPDDKYIYATIATNASVSSLYVYERTTGKRIAKVPLVHQADKIFSTNDDIIVSGSHGIKATDHTTIISAKDYSIKKDWSDVKIYNLSPDNQYSIIYNWDKKTLSTFDLVTGEKKIILDGSEMHIYPISSAFTSDGNYFIVAQDHDFEYYKDKKAGEYESLYILNNKLIDDPIYDIIEEEETIATEETEPVITNDWISYSHSQPNFNVNLPAEAKAKESTTKSGKASTTITSSTKTDACVISAVEIKGVKAKKYKTLAQKMGEDFINKKTPSNVKKSSYSFNGQEGVQYTFRIDKFEYIYRSFCQNGYAYQLIYIAPQLNADDYNKFFDSFKFI